MKNNFPDQTTAPFPALRLDKAGVRVFEEKAAVEIPFEIRLNGRSHTLLMVNPQGLEELARGFCFSEAVVDRPGDILDVAIGEGEVSGMGPVAWADVHLSPGLARRARVKRAAPAATSCGLCGLESFSDLLTNIDPVTGPGFVLEFQTLFKLRDAMVQEQPVYLATGGTHAACLATAGGKVLTVQEDVGRHNALDKALGRALLDGHDLGSCLALLSGRISYEMALKIGRAGIPLVGSVSAPTGLGWRILDELGVTLVGFIRGGRATVYTHPERVSLDGQPLPRDL